MENINLDKIIKADELDTNMILSVPEEIGLKLQKIIQGQASQQEKSAMNLEIIENPNDNIDMDESRKMIFKINDQLLPITILDLPCIIEAQKTIDYKTFYKSGDIAQMMFVHDKEYKLDTEAEIADFNPSRAGDETFDKMVWKKDYDHKYKCKHGLGKGTRNIRARRFKRKIRYNHEEILDVAKKLKSIIDNGAASFENQMKNKELEGFENQSLIHSTSDLQTMTHPANLGSSNLILPMPEPAFSSSGKKKKKAATEFNVPLSTNKKPSALNFNIPLDSNFPTITSQPLQTTSNLTIPTASHISKEDQLVIDEYLNLKDQYKKVKKEIEKQTNPDEELIKRKKKIKKRLKEIKKTYKEEGNN